MTVQASITFKDTLLYMPCALKKLPKCMGITDDVVKGFFPYTFLNRDTTNYEEVLSLIAQCLKFNRMNQSEKHKFEEFYNSYANGNYNIKAECMKYCVQDEDILRKTFEKFRKMFIDIFIIDCLSEFCTIASLRFRIFKAHFMKPRTIAQICRDGHKPY